MTSDGISTEDWDQIHELAIQVANAEDDDEDRYRGRLLAYLRNLTLKYGERPSILATEADYVDEPQESERLFLRAFDLAVSRHDTANTRAIALSLANLYAREFRDLVAAPRWLEIAHEYLEPHHEVEWREYRRIEESIRHLKGQ
jgi:hypothetical protein